MTRYANISGDSGVTEYRVGADSIVITFRGGGTYLYNYQRPGRDHVERMKALALSGRGLSTYISRHVKDLFAAKLHG